jgi:hypothetical protein
MGGGGSGAPMGSIVTYTTSLARYRIEVRYVYMEGRRFRHTGQFVRWRPDRVPESSTYEQREQPVNVNLEDILTWWCVGTTGRNAGCRRS